MGFLSNSLALLAVVVLVTGAPLDQAQLDSLAKTSSRIIFGEETSLKIINPGSAVWHLEFDQYNESSILFSFGSSLRTSVQAAPIVGSIDVSGYVEGQGRDARFSQLSSFYQLKRDQVLVTDTNNHCLRTVDRNTETTATWVGQCTVPGHVDGAANLAQFNAPSDILLDVRTNKAFIIVDNWNHALRSIDIATKEVTTIYQDDIKLERIRSATFDITDSNYLYITIRFQVLRFSFVDNSLNLITGGMVPLGFADGPFDEALLGYWPAGILQLDPSHLAVADFWNHDVRIVDLDYKQVDSMCQPKRNDSIIDAAGCNFNSPHGLLYVNETLYIGELGNIRQIPVSFSKPGQKYVSKFCVPRNITAVIQDGEETATVEIEKGRSLTLEAGEHQYIFKGCVIHILVKGPKETCPPSINRVASADTKTAAIDLKVHGISQQFTLPIGQYPYYIKSADLMCYITINVYDDKLIRRLEFQADYNFECGNLALNVPQNLVMSMAENNFLYIQEICQGVCTKQDDSIPILSCNNSKLTITYPTNLTYGGDVADIPKDVKDNLTARLISKGTMMSIVDATKTPPVIFPTKNADGSSARLVLSTSCKDKKDVYDKTTDTCA